MTSLRNALPGRLVMVSPQTSAEVPGLGLRKKFRRRLERWKRYVVPALALAAREEEAICGSKRALMDLRSGNTPIKHHLCPWTIGKVSTDHSKWSSRDYLQPLFSTHSNQTFGAILEVCQLPFSSKPLTLTAPATRLSSPWLVSRHDGFRWPGTGSLRTSAQPVGKHRSGAARCR